LPEEVAELEHTEPSEALREQETATQKEHPEVLYVDESANDWDLYDGFEGIRRLGPPAAEPRRVSPWEQPLTNIVPFSPFGALVDRFGRTTKIVSGFTLIVVVSGLVVASSLRWWKSHMMAPIAPVVATTDDTSKPVTPVETQPTGKTESAPTLQTTQSAQQLDVSAPQPSAPPTTDSVVTQPSEGQHATRAVSRINKTPRGLYTRQPKSVTDYSQEAPTETERPAAVTVVPKDPTPAKPAPRTNDLLTQPPVGNANKKRVIQWP